MIHKPAWFSDEEVVVSSAPTCGLGRGGRLLPVINRETGQREFSDDPETGDPVFAVDDQLLADLEALQHGKATETLSRLPREQLDPRTAVPAYYDRRHTKAFMAALESQSELKPFGHATLGELIEKGWVEAGAGHGSPSRDERVGNVPYIKVSDLRAGFVNINPTNRVPLPVAEQAWGGVRSGLQAFDLISPARTSKNIGDFCVLLPGQEQVVLTKEMIVLRPTEAAPFSSFFLLWALTLKVVREQWSRIVLMQTNREDVGKRYHEILVPISSDEAVTAAAAEPFQHYYTKIAQARAEMAAYLTESSNHHFYITGAESKAVPD